MLKLISTTRKNYHTWFRLHSKATIIKEGVSRYVAANMFFDVVDEEDKLHGMGKSSRSLRYEIWLICQSSFVLTADGTRPRMVVASSDVDDRGALGRLMKLGQR
ncbi:uncharacterized protein PHALS_09277 [Plasmopara halstedii]|uniref:Uncharacterized protein n=1 Tax=Plasmopara halstedii TaxID=4781 RepID=A0A0P1ADZ5_PLAHL|nr:uncharacterized protein PHALS_09277 [Plasmopara halstedii]CEG39224.1 hypothetical protein PHALS_09277 [Plasmopara halstedii]|eukprot:XP_024575593.1 hypothetical protein PHALS_09277 [Plasmopara halstedii]